MKIKKISLVITSLVVMILSGCSNSTQNDVADTFNNNISTTVEADISDEESNSSGVETNERSTSSDIFYSLKISDNTTRIHGASGELMYLVEGTEKAILIDTASGDGNIQEYVEKITSKPIIVLLTHGHIDHASGASDFNEVYMNHADDPIYKGHVYDRLNGKAKPASDFKDLKDGDVFNLGGTTLEIYAAAGHTPGQMAILFKEARILLLGDAANQFTFLDKNSYSIGEYEKSMKDLLAKTEGRFDKVYVSHGSGDAPKEILDGVIQVCEDIKTGKADNEPSEFLGQQVFIAKKVNTLLNRVDGGVGNIVYTKEKIPE